VPNVTFISQSFMPIALAQRVMQGMPDQPVIQLPEMVSKTVDEVHAIADEVYPKLIEALLG
jgi:hypothetical protein